MLREQLREELKAAMKAKKARRVSTLRLILAALKDRDISARGKGNDDGIAEDAILAMLQSMVKQRRDSIELYEKGGRLELAQQEAEEIEIIQSFLPKQMSDNEIVAAVDQIVAETGAAGIKDMGRVMAALRDRHAGCMDFGKASSKVKALLT